MLESGRNFYYEGSIFRHGKTVYFMILLKILFPLRNLALSQSVSFWKERGWCLPSLPSWADDTS